MVFICQINENYRASSITSQVSEFAPELSITDNPADPEWDEFVSNHPDGHHVQSSLWSQLKQLNGWEPVRLIARQGGQIVAGVQILSKSIPVPLAGYFGYAPKGPLFSTSDEAFQRSFLSEVRRVLQNKRIQVFFRTTGKFRNRL